MVTNVNLTRCWESLVEHAQQRPTTPALWFHSKGSVTEISWQEMLASARRYAAALRHQGVVPGDVVIILLDHSIDQYFSFIGAMLIGAIPSFMPPLTSKQSPEVYWPSHAALFRRIEPKAIVISSAREQQLREFISVSDMAILVPERLAEGLETPHDATSPDQIAFLQHSSGTTQLKKGVTLTHRAVLAQVAAYAAELRIGPDDRIASWLPLYHDMGLIACFITPLVLGIPVAALDPFEWVVRPDLLLRAIERYRCTLAWMPNFAFHHLARTRLPETRYDLASMRAWIDCSEPCHATSFDLFAGAFSDCGVTPERLQVCYAMAETVFAVSQTTVGSPVRRLRIDAVALQLGRVMPVGGSDAGREMLSAGRPLPGIEVAIVDDDEAPLPEGNVGEVTVRGSFVFSGYYRLPEMTDRKLRNGWYHTADLGFFWQGELYVLGRADDLIIVNGRNFFCHEVERMVATLPGLKPGRSVLFAIEDAASGSQAAILVCEPESDDDRTTSTLKRQIRQFVQSACDLALHEVYLAPPGWLVKTTSGKISRHDNRTKYLMARAAAPTTPGFNAAEFAGSVTQRA